MAQIQPPETFEFSTPNEWPKWRKRFERYLVVSGMKKKEEADKIDLFMYLMADRTDDIFRTFKFEKEEEATKIDSILKAIQEDREPVDEFITSLYKLADSCEFEGLHEQLIRDRIVVGVRDKALSERMQLDSELTLEKAVKMVRQQEAVRQQQVDLQRSSTSKRSIRKKEKSAKTRSRCPKCGGFTHREGQACRAEGQRCNLCSKTGHFANCCPDKQAKTAEVKAVSELDEEKWVFSWRRRWTAEIQVNGKQVKFKLDSQADFTCVPLCLFKKIMGQQRLVESDINIRAAEFSELQTVDRKPYEIKLKPGAKPYAVHTPRRVPIPLMEKLKTRLEELDKDDILTKIFEAQQEDTTLKAVVNYLEQGWPDKKMSQALLSYWHVKDELGVQNGLLMRSCHLVIPASMKLEILDKLHAGHLGITKTRLRARETVWWPGISEEIAETVRKCSVCIQEAVSKHEPLIPTNFPTRPWQKIGMDLFKFENKWYLVVIDYYSRFPEIIQLDRLTANVVNNGTQFEAAHEFENFARQYGFTHVTSSPRFPQSNGMAEAGVKIAKLILKKNQDPSLGLLEYRSTPLENGYSPAELLMGRKLRTTLPIAPENLNPRLVDSQTLKRKEGRRRKDMKSRYDRRCGATDMEELSEGDTVWITDMRIWGIVKQKASTPRSYMVDTPVGTVRQNRFHLRKGDTVQYPADPSTPTSLGEELVENEKTPVVNYPSNHSEDGQIRTWSGELLNPWITFIINYIMHLKFAYWSEKLCDETPKGGAIARGINPPYPNTDLDFILVKKDVFWRFCADYRGSNKVTKKDVYPLPQIDDALDSLRGKKSYTLVDLKSGFCQIEIDKEDREKTAFVMPDGLFQIKIMLFGIFNAPRTFKRMIDRGLRWITCSSYLLPIP
ncbi:K02A2.6-like [Cordylochernes scorpioides]|uniref:RNA-directed DNA polymerase n=1 Tax=Cordylochernes scorpioides TaxID=51811 RepID=A0ABY6LVZ1_9ARAC|nr:K02A2.6-like [Cordylochernes scorpioides]